MSDEKDALDELGARSRKSYSDRVESLVQAGEPLPPVASGNTEVDLLDESTTQIVDRGAAGDGTYDETTKSAPTNRRSNNPEGRVPAAGFNLDFLPNEDEEEAPPARSSEAPTIAREPNDLSLIETLAQKRSSELEDIVRRRGKPSK